MPQQQVASARADRRPVIVMLSHLRWDFVFQRPHHLASRAAEDYDVIFIEEPLSDEGGFAMRQGVRENGVQLVQPLAPPYASQEELLAQQERVLQAVLAATEDRQRILWFYTPMALAFARDAQADLYVFDKMDELASFAGAPAGMRMLEAELMGRADIVFTGGVSLHETIGDRHPNAYCFPSSIDQAHFGEARLPLSEPEALVSLPRPRVGFFGVIDERLDYGLIGDLASIRPHWQIVMIGPTAKIDAAMLPRAANLHWLGARPYQRLPHYLAHLDVGWMPFALNDATRFISPTKTPEFLSAGLPLVSSPIKDVIEPYGREGLVKIADGVAEHASAIDSLLAQAHREELRSGRLAAVDAFLAENSWDRTWAAMDALLNDTLGARLRRPHIEMKESAVV